MANILFTADEEEGHLIPSFGLARQLMQRGHQVAYIGMSTNEPMIVDQGLPFIRIKDAQGSGGVLAKRRGRYCDLLFEENGELDERMRCLRPEAVVLAPDLAIEGLLMHLIYDVAVVFLRPTYFQLPRRERIIRSAWTALQEARHADRLLEFCRKRSLPIKSISDLAARIESFPELVMLPEGFEGWHTKPERNAVYVGPVYDHARHEELLEGSRTDGAGPLILGTLGSQCHRAEERSVRLFQTLVQVAAARPDWHFMISVGARIDTKQFSCGPNVVLKSWLPQLQILANASLAIIHAGIGTVRDCIATATPMLLLPLMRDQYACAESVVKHGLGERRNIDTIEPAEFISVISSMLSDGAVTKRMTAMQSRWKTYDDGLLGALAVERVLPKCQARREAKPGSLLR